MGQRSAEGGSVVQCGDHQNADADLAARAVLVGVLDSDNPAQTLRAVLEIVTLEDFRLVAHRRILEAVSELVASEGTIDEVSVSSVLGSDSEAARCLTTLADGIPRKLP